jgi:hypothetical protein
VTLDSARIAIFSGEFGCGKSEIAVNLAVELANEGGRVALLDLDVVKAHFRSRQAAERVRAAGVEMVAPLGDLADFELPAINPRVPALLSDAGCRVVMDIGGGEAGVRILRVFGEFLPLGGPIMYLVVNPYRPYSRTPDQIAASFERISDAAGRPIDAIISNPHLGERTDKEIILRGHRIVVDGAALVGKEVRALVVWSGRAAELEGDGSPLGAVPIYKIDLYLRPPWERRALEAEDRELGEAQDRCRTVQGL